MAHSTPGQLWLVAYEMRDPIGRIVVEIDSAWRLRRNAFIRERAINDDPADHGMVAWVAQTVIADAPGAVPRAAWQSPPAATPPTRPAQEGPVRAAQTLTAAA